MLIGTLGHDGTIDERLFAEARAGTVSHRVTKLWTDYPHKAVGLSEQSWCALRPTGRISLGSWLPVGERLPRVEQGGSATRHGQGESPAEPPLL